MGGSKEENTTRIIACDVDILSSVCSVCVYAFVSLLCSKTAVLVFLSWNISCFIAMFQDCCLGSLATDHSQGIVMK